MIKKVHSVPIFLTVIILSFILFNMLDIEMIYLKPRDFSQIIGVPLMIISHQDSRHLVSNIIPIFLMLMLLTLNKRYYIIVISILLLSTSLLFVFGKSDVSHIGSSILAYGLFSFIIFSYVLDKYNIKNLVIMSVVIYFFWNNIISGLKIVEGVSLEGHWYGILSGVIVAYVLYR